MRRLAITAAAALAFSSAANAAPWEYQTDYVEHEAWQGSKDGDYVLAFACEGFGADAYFYIATPEPYEETTSYADRVPTIFAVTGKSITVPGVFEERAGSLGVFYEYTEESAPLLDQLFAMIATASGDIRVDFFDKKMAFPLEEAAPAMHRVASAPNDCHLP